MSIGVKAKQLGGELREKAKELGQKVEAKALEAQGKLQDKLFDGKLGQVIGGNHSDFTDTVVSKLNLSAFKDAPPPPVLKRPVVMIPGLTMPAQSFDRMGDQLATNKANGPVVVYVASQDKFRLGDQQGREVTAAELKSAKIFEVEYGDPWASPTKKAPQIAKAMERIAQATGTGSVDVVTHSAGGTDFRLYLDGRDPAKGPKIEHAAGELAVGSKMINDLNATWDRQRDQIPGGITTSGTTGTPTLGPAKGAFEDGDGYMPSAQLDMPGATTVRMEGPHNTPLAHLWQVQYSGVVNAAFDVLGK
jgi:hypothetical protein